MVKLRLGLESAAVYRTQGVPGLENISFGLKVMFEGIQQLAWVFLVFIGNC